MSGQVAIRKWGNSQGIVIPGKILRELQWNAADELQMEVVGEQLILRKPYRHKTFEERMAAFDGKVDVTEYDWGNPAGREKQ